MRDLLKTSDLRRLELIELLLEMDEWATIPTLAEHLDSSTRNIKEDIAFLRRTEPELGIESSHLGFRIMMDQTTGIQEYYRKILKETLIFQVLEEIFFDETLSIDELARVLPVSSSTIYRTVKTLNAYFSEFDCRIETNPCRVVGDEEHIRRYYRTYFKESYTLLEWPFRNLKEATVNAKFNRVLAALSRDENVDDDVIDFAFYESIKLMTVVNSTRYGNGHKVDTSDNESFLFKVIFNVVKLYAKSRYSSKLNLNELTPEYIYQVYYPYFEKNAAFGIKPLNRLRKKNATVNEAVTYLEESLQSLANSLAIEINSEELLVALYGTVYIEEHDANGMHILYDRNKLFNQRIQWQFPKTYQALYDMCSEFRRLLGRSADEDKLNYLVYTLFTYWEQLLTDLYGKYQKPRVLVLSGSHFTHANTIKQFLAFELNNNITIDVYQNHILSFEILKELDYDLIVSTFQLPQFGDKQTLLVEHYLTQYDIRRIEAILRDIIQAKRF